ncbi:hypothetical protein BDM02DRAFT_3182788 [Thelephora ganbajun]|uniref:Uncharacterized protein n=1 Tax=Thelephora ganbajun TaxID=370292 RepID=A0ACB6ZUM6_THEGA|nr:hypothetical protein BDM02DRAFT_3182788 [Thelephora ganbajun]
MPIAVVGVAARLPSNPDDPHDLDYPAFWDFLINKGQGRARIPAERLQGISDMLPTDVGTFLKDVTSFDNVEFGLSSKDALSMSSSTRRSIEISFLALLDSGIDSRRQRVGTFCAGTNIEGSDPDHLDNRGVASGAYNMANRVAFALDLNGPSFFVDTACSSTLTATHLAIRLIEAGDCDAAVVIGCQHNLNIWDWIIYHTHSVLSSGYCKPFDASADGFIKGEGAVSIVIKPLEAALASNDHIYAVMLGTAINANGGDASLMAPSGPLQRSCLEFAFKNAGRDPNDVDYVELHATGTSVGDPLEANAAGEFYARKDDHLIVGSVKGNIGHLESTAFLASLMKVCLIFEKKMIPPNVNLSNPNPKIRWDEHRLKVALDPTPLSSRSGTGRSLVSMASSGIGGANGHIVLESPPSQEYNHSLIKPGSPVLFIVGGLSPRAAHEISASLINILSKDSSPQALSQAVKHARRARQMSWRSHFVFTPSFTELPANPEPVLAPKDSAPVVFVFTGQGPQHIRMGKAFFSTYPVFRESILELDAIYERVAGSSLIKTTGLFSEVDEPSLPSSWPADITIPAITMFQIAMVDLLATIGIRPTAVVGHSAGETPMLYAAGAGPKEMALKIAIARANAMKITEVLNGGMAALGCSEAMALEFINHVLKDAQEGVLEVGCHNSPEAVVITGSSTLIDEVLSLTPPMMEVCKEEYLGGVRGVFEEFPGPHAPTIPCYSTVAGHGKNIEEFTTGYLWENLRRPVYFHQAISSILEDHPNATFIEISPHPALSSYISATGARLEAVVCPSRRLLRIPDVVQAELKTFLSSIGTLSTLGVNSIDLTPLYGCASRDPAYDIHYPFTERHFPMRVDGPRLAEPAHGGSTSLILQMNAKSFPDLAEHVINGEPVVPAATFIDMVLQTGAKILWDININHVLSLTSDTPIDVRVDHDKSRWELKSYRRNLLDKSVDIRVHSSGFSSTNPPKKQQDLDYKALWDTLPAIEIKDFHEKLKPLAEFGPLFRRLKRIHGGPTEGLVEIDGTIDYNENYIPHPVLLDSCLHYCLHPDIIQNIDKGSIFLPSKLKRFLLYGTPAPGGRLFSRYVMKEWTPDTRVYDITIYDEMGSALCSMNEFELRKNTVEPTPHVNCRYEMILQPILAGALSPRLDRTWAREREDKAKRNSFLRTLDRLAYEMLQKSLDEEIQVGEKIDRKRYEEFARRVVARSDPPAPISHDVEAMKKEWPAPFEIMGRLSKVHKGVFSSSTATVQALFADGVLNRFYGDFLFGEICSRAATAFGETITAFAASGKRVLRVLEVGAGTGLLTRSLCGVLIGRSDVIVEYVVSDVSSALANSAVKTVSYDRAFAKALDLSRPPQEQGFDTYSFDIITGLHVLHAVPDIAEVLASLCVLLVPGGSLLVVELDGTCWENVSGALWNDTVFGSFAEWFGSTDGRSHPSLSPGRWGEAIGKAGFEDYQSSAEADDGIEFLFTAKVSQTYPIPQSTSSEPVFLSYTFGQEIALQQQILALDATNPLQLWILAKDGIDGDSITGLASSLANEYATWEAHAAIFPLHFDYDRQKETVLTHRHCLKNETVVRFDASGMPHVPKVFYATSPEVEEASLDHKPSTSLQQGHVSINILSRSSSSLSYHGFVGSVLESRSPNFRPGDIVAGVTKEGPTNRITCSAGCIVPISEGMSINVVADHSLALVIASIILGPERDPDTSMNAPPLKVVLVNDDDLSQDLFTLLSLVPNLAAVYQHDTPLDSQFDVIVSSLEESETHPEYTCWGSNLLLWDQALSNLLNKTPWRVGYFVRMALKLFESTMADLNQSLSCSLRTSSPKFSEHSRSTVLFDPEKSYILIGGCGDLGVHLALWMYQHGARYVVLTSRRGRRFLDTDAMTLTKLEVAYLENRHDFVLKIEACDATSSLATSRLVRGLEKPLGGAILMSLVLSDGLFASQTEAGFKKVMDAKWGALSTFNDVWPIKYLDFFISFSSVASMLGNPGQSNYAAANSIVDGFLHRHPNAFSVVLPGISDLGYFARIRESSPARATFSSWSMTSHQLFNHLGDALLKLKDGSRASLYIPDLNWNNAKLELSGNSLHLLTRVVTKDQTEHIDQLNLHDKLLALLGVSASDFSPRVPFTAYGMDSLSATRLSQELRPYVVISQMQLLGGMTWVQLQARIDETKGTTEVA